MPGPPPTPTNVLAMRGSWRAKTRTGEPQIHPGMPDMPEYLDEAARAEWARIAPALAAVKVLSPLDGSVLGDYCQATADVDRLTRAVREEGEIIKTPRGFDAKNPKLTILREARTRQRKAALELGMTPASRTRVQALDRGTLGKLGKYLTPLDEQREELEDKWLTGTPDEQREARQQLDELEAQDRAAEAYFR